MWLLTEIPLDENAVAQELADFHRRLCRYILQPMSPATRRLTLCAAMAIAWALRTSTSATAQSIYYKEVSRVIVEARLREYIGKNEQREATLKQLFVEAGCDEGEHLSEQVVKGSKLPNVICVLPGTSGRVVIVGAHFDRTPQGDGVVDNWSGASLLPSLYEAVKFEPRRHTYIFIGFTDEEQGEIGSRFYARQMTEEQVAATDAMVNMDTLGLGPTEVWASHSDKQLTSALAYVARQLNLHLTGVNFEQIGSTDSEQFAERRIRRITAHSLTQQSFDARILHTSKDRLSAMRLDDYYQTYRLLCAYLAYLDLFLNALDVKFPDSQILDSSTSQPSLKRKSTTNSNVSRLR